MNSKIYLDQNVVAVQLPLACAQIWPTAVLNYEDGWFISNGSFKENHCHIYHGGFRVVKYPMSPLQCKSNNYVRACLNS